MDDDPDRGRELMRGLQTNQNPRRISGEDLFLTLIINTFNWQCSLSQKNTNTDRKSYGEIRTGQLANHLPVGWLWKQQHSPTDVALRTIARLLTCDDCIAAYLP